MSNMNKSTADLDAELAALSDRAEALSAELQRRQEIERAWKAGKRVEWKAWPERQRFEPKWRPLEGAAPSYEFCWGESDYRIAPEAPQAPEAVWVNLDSFGPARTPGGVTRIAFASRDEARKAVPGSPEDRVVRYEPVKPGWGWGGHLWITDDGWVQPEANRTASEDAMRKAGYRRIQVREVKT